MGNQAAYSPSHTKKGVKGQGRAGLGRGSVKQGRGSPWWGGFFEYLKPTLGHGGKVKKEKGRGKTSNSMPK